MMEESSTSSLQVISTSLNSDVQLLLCCFARNRQIDSGAFLRLETANFLNTLESHRLTSAFYIAAKQNQFIALPALDLLEGRYTTKKIRMLTLVAELHRVIKQLDRAKIAAVALKGPLLGQQYYGDPAARECNDLDILVKPSDVQAAYKILSGMGYKLTEVLWDTPKQESLYHKIFHHYNLYNANTGIIIELHWRLYSSSRVDRGATENIWRNLSFQKLAGLQIRVLSKLDTFIYLCVHGSAHQWKRLFWVLDIVRIIEKEGEEFVHLAFEKSVARGVVLHVLQGCHLSCLLFDVKLPLIIQSAIKDDKRIEQLTAMSLFAMDHVTTSRKNPVASWGNLSLARQKIVNYYRTAYYLGGHKALSASIKRFFINPKFWRIYSFSDSLFVLNYIAAPFLWAYSVFTRNTK